MKKNPHRPDSRKYLDNLLINYTKGSYDVDIEEITRLAVEIEFDIYAEPTPENYSIYFERLLNGPKNEDHYGELATYLYDRGYLDEAINYLNVGTARLGAEKVSEFISYLKDEFWMGKIFFGGNPYLTNRIRKAAHYDFDILIEGETGTGKELAADLIHDLSSRHKNPHIKFSFATIPSNLIESELFGHVEGYFTDAKLKKGLLEEAKDGDIFLDEINELDPTVQIKLNRVLQQRKFRLLGTSKEIDLKARIIFGTNMPSKILVKSGRMREDFFYRISKLTISLPPLAGRGYHDFKGIVNQFVEKYNRKYDKEIEISSEALKRLYAHNWPGNFRELGEDVIEPIIATTDDKVIKIHHVNEQIKNLDEVGSLLTEATNGLWSEERLLTAYQNIVLAHHQGSIKKASKTLKINESTLRRRLKSKTPRKK
jgi:transcriptional regulator with PAS, ATPase and Fis domain